MATITSNGSFTTVTVPKDSTITGSMSWSIPTLPSNATIKSTTLTFNLTISMTKDKAEVTINGTKYDKSTDNISISLGTSLTDSMSVTIKGKKNAEGTVSISNIVYTVEYEVQGGADEPPTEGNLFNPNDPSMLTPCYVDILGNLLLHEDTINYSILVPITPGYNYKLSGQGFTRLQFVYLNSEKRQTIRGFGRDYTKTTPPSQCCTGVAHSDARYLIAYLHHVNITNVKNIEVVRLTQEEGNLFNPNDPNSYVCAWIEGNEVIFDNYANSDEEFSLLVPIQGGKQYNVSCYGHDRYNYVFLDSSLTKVSSVSIAPNTGTQLNFTTDTAPSNASYLLLHLQSDTIHYLTDVIVTKVGGEVLPPPIITIVSQDRIKISKVNGYDRCTVTFISDQALTYWEARAITTQTPSQTPSHGVGTLVESGTLEKGATGYIYVDDEELLNGDVNYRIDIYGQNAGGVWSDDE